jgi:hypothetical protein
VSANNSITLALNLLGLSDAKEAVQVLGDLKRLSGEMQQLGVYPPIQGPLQQGAQGVNKYESLNAQLTEQFKQNSPILMGMQQHEDRVLSLARNYALLRQEAVQLDSIFSRWRSDDRFPAMENVAGFARSTGQNAVAYGQQIASFQQMGAISTSSQASDLSGVLAQAVEKGSTNAYRLQYDDILPYLQGLTQQAMMVAPQGANVAGMAGSLAGLNAAAPGLRGGGAAQAYQALSGDISDGGGYAGIVALQTYQQQNPGAGYGSFMYDRETAAQDPDFFNQYIANLFNSMGGQESDPEAKKFQLSFIAKQTGLSAHSLDAIVSGLADYDPATKQLKAKPGIKFDDLKKKYGAPDSANDAMLPYLAMADSARSKGGGEIQTALQNYRDATGDTQFVPKGATSDEQAADLAKHIAQSKSNFGNNRGDQMKQSQADQDAAQVEFGKGVRDTTQAMQGLNTSIIDLTKAILGNPIGGGALGVSQAAGQIGGGLLNGVTSGLSTYMLLRTLGPALGDMGGGLGKGVLTKALSRVPVPEAVTKALLPDSAMTFGGEATAGLSVGLGAIAAGGFVGYQALHEQPKRDQAAEAKRTEQEKEDRYQAYERDKQDGGILKHPKYLFMDDAQSKDIQAREARDKAAGVSPGASPAAAPKAAGDDVLLELRAHTGLLAKIETNTRGNYDQQVVAGHPVTSATPRARRRRPVRAPPPRRAATRPPRRAAAAGPPGCPPDPCRATGATRPTSRFRMSSTRAARAR